MNCILSELMCKYNINNFSQFQTCCLTILFPTWKMIIKAFCSVFYLLYKSFHQVPEPVVIYLVFQPKPFASIIVPSGTVSVNGSSARSIPQLFKELITSKGDTQLRTIATIIEVFLNILLLEEPEFTSIPLPALDIVLLYI